MKIFLKIVPVMVLSCGLIHAAHHEPELPNKEQDRANALFKELAEKDVEALFQKAPGRLELFSQPHADAFKHSLLSEESARMRYRYLLGAAVAGVSTYLLYQFCKGWWVKPDEKSKPWMDQLADQGGKVKDLETKVAALEKNVVVAKEPALTWNGYFWAKTKNLAGWIGAAPAYIFSSALLGIGINQTAGLARRVGMYLFEDRTIAWCIETKTAFKARVRDVVHWADELVAHPSNLAIERQMLFLCMSFFKQEIEKVVGYMGYVNDEINAAIERIKASGKENADLPVLENAHTLAGLAISATERCINELVDESNAYIQGQKELDKDRQKFASRLRSLLRMIIHHMEQFEGVQYSVGYENFDRNTLFEDLLALLDPEVVTLRAQVKEVTKLQSKVRDFEQVLDHIKQQRDNGLGDIESFLNPF